jgi:hypothetical protein
MRIVKRVLCVLFVMLSFGVVNAQRGGASVDGYQLNVKLDINFDTKAAALSSNGQTVNPAIKNLVLILVGQSNCSDVVPSAYVPANPTKIDQLNIYDGAIRVAGDPLIGSSYPRTAGAAIYGPGNAYLRVADGYVAGGKFDRVILVPICIGATLVVDWAPGGFIDNVFPVAMRRLTANGIVAGANVTIAAIWAQGESDTDAGTSQAAYTNSLNAFITASRTAGFAGLWFINVETRSAGATSAAIAAAQAAVVNHGASIWAGANADALAGNVCSGAAACRQADDTHWSNAGAVSIAAATVTAHASPSPYPSVTSFSGDRYSAHAQADKARYLYPTRKRPPVSRQKWRAGPTPAGRPVTSNAYRVDAARILGGGRRGARPGSAAAAHPSTCSARSSRR